MKGRVLAVVEYLTRCWAGRGRLLEDPRELWEELLAAGFDEDDVERALVWLQRVGPGQQLAGAAAGGERRVATAEEALRLTARARGELLQMERCGLIDAGTREMVFERALRLDEPCLDLPELRVLVALLVGRTPGGDERLAAHLLDDDMEHFYH